MKLHIPLIALMLIFLSYSPVFSEGESPALSITEKLIVDFKETDPLTEKNHLIVVSPDNLHLAWVCETANSNGYSLFVDGKELDKEITPLNFMFSPDSSTFLFSFTREKNFFLRCGEKVYGPFDDITKNSLTFSPDSKQWACVVRVQESSFVLLCGEPQTEFNNVNEFAFSPDSHRFGYIGTGKEGTILYVNGKKNDKFDHFENLAFSPGKKGYSVLAMKGEKFFPLVNGRKGQEIIGPNSDFIYSPDGKTSVFVAETEDGTLLISNGKATEINSVRDPLYSPDGKELALVRRSKDKEDILLGKKTLKGHDRVTAMEFSPQGSRFVFTATMTFMEVLIENGSFNAEYHDVIDPVFTPDDKHLFFCAKRDNTIYLLRDKVVFAQYEGDHAECLAVSGNGQLSTFLLCKGKESTLIVNGGKENEFTRIFPTFMGHTSYRYSQRGALSIQSTETPFYGSSNYKIVVDSNSSFHFIARRKNAFYLVSGEIKER